MCSAGDEGKAKKSLKWLARINESYFDIDSVHLNDVDVETEENSGSVAQIVQTMQDFMKYR